MAKQKQRAERFTYSFSLNKNTENDLIELIDSLNGVVTISQFVKLCMKHYQIDLNDLINAEDIVDEEQRKKEFLDTTYNEVKYYLEEHK